MIYQGEGCRLDVFLSNHTEHSRSRVQGLIRDGQVSVNGAFRKANYVLRDGDCVLLQSQEPVEIPLCPQNIPLNIVFEDKDLVVIDKPQGMVVHPAPGHECDTMVNALMYHVKDLSGIGGELRPGIVHRIDRMTSGLIVVAKNDAAHIDLGKQFADHTAGRQYLALVDGNIKQDRGTVDAPIGRHPNDRKKMAIVPSGRHAVTHWEVLERFQSHTLIRARLETGRTHQIRVHMASQHHPLAGDTVYGAKKAQLGLEGQALHGYHLRFVHPVSGEECQFYSRLPDYYLSALKKLGYSGTGDEWTADPERNENR